MTSVTDGRLPDDEGMRIGAWTVEPSLNRLSSSDAEVRLEPKAMEVLRVLAAQPGKVVTREALLVAVWPGLVVGDDSLTQVVIKLRKALGDAADQPTYIQTIPKRGYRLVAPVVRADAMPTLPADPRVEREPEPSSRRSRRSSTRWTAAIAAGLFASAAWWFVADDSSGPMSNSTEGTAVSGGAGTGQPTISVRNFEALGSDPRATLLAQGITADLTTDLTKVAGLSVIAWPPSDAAGRLDSRSTPARYLVTGSVQHIAQRLRLHVRLIDQQTGEPLWSERFDRIPDDLFAMQEELVPRILGTLPAKVTAAELQRMARRHTRNLEAYEHFQRGQAALLVRQQQDNEIARDMFRRAIALDATFARAYAGLALTYAADYRNRWSADSSATLDRALAMARTAHQIDPDIRETDWVLAFVHLERRQHQEALQYLESVIRLHPSFADAYALMAGVKTYIGQPNEALPLLRTAMRLNPEAGHLYFLNLGRTYFALGDLEQARVNLDHALARNPVNLETLVYLAAVQAAAGEIAAAAWNVEEIRALHPGFSMRTWLETHPLTDATQQEQLVGALKKAGL